MSNDIYGFTRHQGTYWLSNFYPCKVEVDGLIYQSSEAAYMAQKCSTRKCMEAFTSIVNAAEAKQLGRKVTLRSDWDTYRVLAMTRAVYAKFSQNPDLATKLLETGDAYLEETNSWLDRFWGTDTDGIGQNMLGNILMFVRSTLREQK